MKELVATDRAPMPIGPYSQAIKDYGFVFVAGQIGRNPNTNVSLGSDVREETQQALENVRSILEAAGSDLSRVVKATVFLTNLSDFAAVNDVYANYFSAAPPARSTIQVAGLPGNALIEIEVIASL